MKTTTRIAMAQINTTVGDLEGNFRKARACLRKAEQAEADIILLPELTIPGYPPEDLLLKRRFILDNQRVFRRLAEENRSIMAIAGFVDGRESIHNAAGILLRGKIERIYHKICLPNYSVFDEKRYFSAGNRPLVFDFDGIRYGLNICEDIWVPDGVAECQGLHGDAEIILSISASPYYVNKRVDRLKMARNRVEKGRSMLAYLNLVGGQDELLFDGNSFVLDFRGNILAEAAQFEEDFLVVDLDVAELRSFRRDDELLKREKERFKCAYQPEYITIDNGVAHKPKPAVSPRPFVPLTRLDEIYKALLIGTRDYLHKNGFDKVVIGLSGGIDSALTAVLAVDALGSENVVGIIMPSQHTSEQSIVDATALARNLEVKTETIPIESVYEDYIETLNPLFEGMEPDITEENLQARIRGNILMALSNKFNWLVLTTGNKSETSVGYSTLYGDMAGGFAVIKDVPKTMVYKLSRHVNRTRGGEVIPKSILTKPPTAELRPDQTDQDSLPPYEVLDSILEEFVEKDKSVREIIAMGFPRDTVKKVARMVDINEYKRRQAPPGIKISRKAFGKDRRMPITNHYQT